MRCGNYWLAVAFTFCATFKRAIKRPNSDPRLFFFSNLFINWQAFIISGKKNTNFFSIVQGSAREKTHKWMNEWMNYIFSRRTSKIDYMLYSFIVDAVLAMDCPCSLGGRTFNWKLVFKAEPLGSIHSINTNNILKHH